MRHMLEKEGVILKGHFLLTSGRHSDVYFEKFRLLENPGILTELIKGVCSNIDKKYDYVAGPVTGGIIVAFEFARQLGCKALYLEKRDEKLGIFRGTPLKKEHRVLIVDDVLTTGKSVDMSIEALKDKCIIEDIAVLIDRSQNRNFEYNLHSAMKMDAVSYDSKECPLCRQGLELIRPGGKR